MSGIWKNLAALLAFAVVLGVAATAQAKPKGLAQFKGKYTGSILVAQGADTRIIGNATIAISSDKSGKKGRINVSGTLNGTTFKPQIFTLKKGKASVNIVLPGYSDFAVAGKGKFKVRGKRVQISMDAAAPKGWPVEVTLQFEPNGAVVSLSGTIKLAGDSDPVYFLVTGA